MTSEPRPLVVIEEELNDLERVLSEAYRYSTPDPASRFGLASLRKRQRELIAERDQVMRGEGG